jgi:hypothetical protein
VAPIPFRLEWNHAAKRRPKSIYFNFFFPIDFLGKSAKKFFVDFIFVFPHPPLKLKQIDRKSSTAFNVQLHRCGSFSPHDRVIDWRGLVVGWLGGVTGGVNPIARLLLLLGEKKYDDVPATQISGILFIAYPPIRPDCFPLPVAHNFVFWWGRVSLFLSKCRSKSAQSSSTTCR